MTERYQHHVKDLPDYIRSIYQHKGVVSIKFSNSHCGDCQKESFQEYANRINTERSIEEVLERENIKCPLHGEYLQLHLSSFSMWEYRIKHATAKIEPLEVPQPPTVPSYLWEEWAKFWNCHKEVYISLFWIHRFEEYCNRDSVSWKSNVFKDLPELEKEIRYCDYIDLCYEIDFTDDSYFSEEVFNKKADILWKELCFKRFWIQFRLYLRNRDFQVVEELGNFFETKGVCGNIEPYDFERNFYLHIPKEVLTYTYVPLYLDIPVEDDADITINVFGAAGVSNRSREESHLTVEAVRGVEWLENLRPPENPDDLLVNPDVENPEQNLVVEHFPDVFINPDVENPEQNLVVENFPDVVVNPDVENPDSNLSDRISPDEHVVNPDIEDSDSVFCGEGSPSAVVGSLDVEIPDSNLSGKLSPNEQIVSPDIENPDQNLSGGSPPDEVVVVTPDAENPDPDLSGESSPDEEVVNPDVENPDPDLSDESSPDEEVVNPDVENPDPDLSGESSPDEGIVVAPGAENPDPDLSGESSDEVVNPDAENPDPDLSGESSPDEEVVVNPDVENPDPDLPGESFPDEGIVVVPGAENPDPDLSGESSPDEEEVNPDVENPDPDLSDECSPDEVVSPDVENPDPDLPGEISPDVQVHGSPSPRNEEDQREEKDKISDESEDLIVSPPQPFEDIEAEEDDSSSDDIIIEDDDESEDLNVPPPQPILDIQVEGVDSPAQDRIQMIQDDYAVENNDLIIPLPELFQDVPPPQPLEEVASNVIQEQVLTEEERENDEIQVYPPVPAVPINEDEGNDGLQLERVDSKVSYVRRLAGSVLARFSHFKRMIMREKDEIQVNPAVPINEDERNDGLQLERVDSTVNYGRHLAGGVLARFSNFRNAVFLRSDSYLSWLNPIFRPRSISGFRFYGYYSDYWWFSYKLQVKYRAENIMQSLEKEIVDFLKSSCDPDLDHVLFYPPLMPCENEHITECWQVRTATLRLDEKIMKICILGKEEIEKEDIGSREISIVQLSKRDQHDEWNELKYGDVVPMELEVFEKKIMRSFQRRPLREAEEEEGGGEPFPRASSAAEAIPPSANSTFNEESFLSGDLIVYPPDDLNPIDINRQSSRPANDFFDEILSFCEAIYHDEGKFDIRNLPCNFDTNYLKFWMRRHTFSSLYSKGVEIIEECWYTTPPEIISKSIAKRIGLRRYRSVIDANCGSGLNAIQLALSNELVIAIDKNPANIRSARNNARIYGVEDKIIYKVGDLSTMDLSEFEPGAIFLNPKTNDPRRILKEYDVLGLGGTSDCKKLLDDARKISPNIVLYLPPHSNIFQVLEVCKPFGKAEIQFNNVSNQKESICVYFGDFVH